MSATTAAPSIGSTLPLKRKASSPDLLGDGGADSDDDQEVDESVATGSTTAAKTTRSGSELVPSTKPGEPPVTKRTLQNRKAQREFRKRREARVKDLEERCRRFDQMGLEANEELQRVARRFKDENEALRGLVIRLGYGSLIAQALDGLHAGNGNEGGIYDHGTAMYPDWSSTQTQQQHPSQPSSASRQQQQSLAMPPAPPGSVNTNSLGDGAVTPWSADATNATHSRSRTEANAANRAEWPQGTRDDSTSSKRSRSATAADSRQHGNTSSRTSDNALLSLNLGGQNAQQAKDEDVNYHSASKLSDANQAAPGTLTPNTFNSLMGMLGGSAAQQQQHQHHHQQQQQQSPPQQPQPSSVGGGGSAFLRNAVHNNMGGPFATAHRPHQNDALLNPNPIPFALNLSNEPQPDQTWWDRNGGGMFGNDSYLDEKAHAVAQAQTMQRTGSQSPFDIGAFLTTGTTPGNSASHFNSMPTGFTPALASDQDGDPLSQAGADLLKSGKEKHSSNGAFSSPRNQHQQPVRQSALNPADHVQTFLRLLERRAIRAGEQRGRQQQQQAPRITPWMDMGSDVASDEDSSNGSGSRSNSMEDVHGPRGNSTLRKDSGASGKMITPNSAYSRLAQHPIFLRTDAAELEVMINSIQNARIATVTAQGSGSGAPLEVDAGAVDVMLEMLDRKQRTGAV